jgi:nicotinamide-nucleotide amidase
MKRSLEALAKNLGKALGEKEYKISTAESFTRGAAAYCLTRLPTSSEWFDRGFVTYTVKAKKEVLGISGKLIEKWNVVSEVVAREMADKALDNSHSQIVMSFTGLAGPTGGTSERPVGMAWIGFAGAGFETFAKGYIFKGSRDAIIEQAIEAAFKTTISLLKG